MRLTQNQGTLRNSVTDDVLQDPSTKRLDKWRSMFHMFNLLTFTVAVISLGLSLLTYASAPPTASNVREYELPMVYYGVNAALMTVHTGFGAFACVKAGNLGFLKIYTAIGLLLVIEELAIGSWMVATIQNRINAVIKEIDKLESSHSSHDHDSNSKRKDLTPGNKAWGSSNESPAKRPSKRDEDETEHHNDNNVSGNEDSEEEDPVEGHLIYKEINTYYGCCMFAQKWIEEKLPSEEVYEHCLTNDDLFCGVKFILFPGGDNLIKSITENCHCERKVKEVVTARIVKQTSLLFIALPSQMLCLFGVAMFIKFEISFRNSIIMETVSIPNPSSVFNNNYNTVE